MCNNNVFIKNTSHLMPLPPKKRLLGKKFKITVLISLFKYDYETNLKPCIYFCLPLPVMIPLLVYLIITS